MQAKIELKKIEATTKQKKRNKKNLIKEFGLFAIVAVLLFVLCYYMIAFDVVGSLIFSLCIAVPFYIIRDPGLTKIERQRIWVIYIISFFVIFFWAAFEQSGASLTYFANEQTDRSFLGKVIPTSYFQSVNAIFIVYLALFFPYL